MNSGSSVGSSNEKITTMDDNVQHITVDMTTTAPHEQRNGQLLNMAPSHTTDTVDGVGDRVMALRERVPRAVPETDDDDDDEYDPRPSTTDAQAGVDDGLLPPSTDRRAPPPRPPYTPPVYRPRRPSFPEFPNYDGTGFVNINGVETPIPDVNAYQHKKTLAQGMMDLALLSANANQLRYVLESYKRHPYYYPSVIFISLSIIFQVAVGVGLILNSRYNIRNEKEICRANKVNNYTVCGIFIVTVVNVFISAFGVADPSGDV